MQTCKRSPYRDGGAAFHEPGLTLCVIALQEENQVGVIMCASMYQVVEEAAKHGYTLCRIFKRIDANEVLVLLTGDVMDCPSLDSSGPFEVPPEGGGLAVAPCGTKASITPGST